VRALQYIQTCKCCKVHTAHSVLSLNIQRTAAYLEEFPSQLGVPFRLALHILLVRLHRLFLLLSIVLWWEVVGGRPGEDEEWEERRGRDERWGERRDEYERAVERWRDILILDCVYERNISWRSMTYVR
jgi:hypothetical protein